MRAMVLPVLLTSAVVSAEAPTDGPRFEVVSIRPNTSNTVFSNGSSERPDGGCRGRRFPTSRRRRRSGAPSV